MSQETAVLIAIWCLRVWVVLLFFALMAMIGRDVYEDGLDPAHIVFALLLSAPCIGMFAMTFVHP